MQLFPCPPRVLASVLMAACCHSGFAAEALAQGEQNARSKLNVGSVALQEIPRGASREVIVIHQGRPFAKLSAPGGRGAALYCCQPTGCTPIQPNTSLFCQIVINCPEGAACYPQ